MFLSVIIPVYNVRETLQRCVDSIVQQGFEDWEMLIVDDGSTDGSGDLADKIVALSDKRAMMRVFHKQNGGLSDARNYGIERCNGDYILFVDSDDAIAPNTLQSIHDNVIMHPDCDILEFPIIVNESSPKAYLQRYGYHRYDDACEYWSGASGFEHSWMCCKAIRRGLIADLRFPVGKIYEDLWMMGSLLKKNPIIYTIDDGLYIYYYNSNGLSKQINGHNLKQLLEAHLNVIGQLGIDLNDARWHRLYMRMLNIQLDVYRALHHVMIPMVKVRVRNYFGMTSLVKSLALRVLGLKLFLRIF